MTEVSPPPWEQNGSHGAQGMRQILQFLAGVGSNGGNLSWPSGLSHPGVVLRPSALKVTVSSGLTMAVAGGAAIVGGSRATNQGGYFCYNHGAKNVTLAAAPGSPNSRIDAVVAQVLDSEKIGSGTDVFQIVKIDGVAASSPSNPDLSSYNDITVLAYCTVPFSGAVTIVDARRVATLDGPPIGSMHDWMADSAPHGYLPCDGAIVNISDYPDLFEILSNHYGGNGTTTFAVPDLRGRVAAGLDDMNAGSTQSDAGNLTAANTLGTVGGEEKHTLTQAELPATISKASYAGGASFDATRTAGGSSGVGAVTGTQTAFYGSGTAMNNMPPYMLVNKIIRAY